MKSVINITQNDSLSDVLRKAEFGKQVVTVKKKGKPYAVILSPEQYNTLQEGAKTRLFKLADGIQSRNTLFREEEVLKDVSDTVADIRKRKHA